jgi:hypothetical protein
MTELSQDRVPKFLPRKTRMVMGVDLGQIQDPTAICVIEHCEGVIDNGSDYERHTPDCLPLRSYRQTQARIKALANLQ